MRSNRLWPLVGALCAASAALATSVPEFDLPTRAARADRVVLAEVVEVSQESTSAEPPRLVTVVTLSVQEDLKGKGAATVQVRQLGGQKGAWRAEIPGAVSFERGERAVFFLRCADASAPDRCAIFGFNQGKLPVVDGGQSVVVPHANAPAGKLTYAELKKALASRGAR